MSLQPLLIWTKHLILWLLFCNLLDNDPSSKWCLATQFHLKFLYLRVAKAYVAQVTWVTGTWLAGCSIALAMLVISCFFFFYWPLLLDRHNRSQANFSRTSPWGLDYAIQHYDLWNLSVGGEFNFQRTLPPQTLTSQQSGGTYENPELTWRVPIITIPDRYNCTKISSAVVAVAWQQFFSLSPNCTFSGFLTIYLQWLKLHASNLVQLFTRSVLTANWNLSLKGACPESWLT